MTDSKSLATCYKYHRQKGLKACDAIERAREDSAADTSRYPRDNPGAGLVGGNPFDRSAPSVFNRADRLTWIEDCAAVGLRFVGYCDEIAAQHDRRRMIEHTGWFTNEFQDSTMRGVVYQFPAKNGIARYVSGYVQGSEVGRGYVRDDGTTDSACLALAMRDWNESDHGGDNDSYSMSDGLEMACRHADGIAERCAERERDYQAAWSLGSDYARHADDVKESAARAKALRAELKEARALATASGVKLPEVCGALKSALASLRHDIAKGKESMAAILRENSFRDELRSAFIDGAGITAATAKRLGV